MFLFDSSIYCRTTQQDFAVCCPRAVFKRGLSQLLDYTFVHKFCQIKPKIWLRPFVNVTPVVSLNPHSMQCESSNHMPD